MNRDDRPFGRNFGDNHRHHPRSNFDDQSPGSELGDQDSPSNSDGQNMGSEPNNQDPLGDSIDPNPSMNSDKLPLGGNLDGKPNHRHHPRNNFDDQSQRSAPNKEDSASNLDGQNPRNQPADKGPGNEAITFHVTNKIIICIVDKLSRK